MEIQESERLKLGIGNRQSSTIPEPYIYVIFRNWDSKIKDTSWMYQIQNVLH